MRCKVRYEIGDVVNFVYSIPEWKEYNASTFILGNCYEVISVIPGSVEVKIDHANTSGKRQAYFKEKEIEKVEEQLDIGDFL